MKWTLLMARMLSNVFRPVYYPILGFGLLFTLTYTSLLPWEFKLWILSIVALFTIFIPWALHRLYRRIHGWHPTELRLRHRRYVPYAINVICYVACIRLMQSFHLPHFMISILAASLFTQVATLVINTKWKISTHAAGAGAIIGALVAYAEIFAFNPTWWLCGSILLDGLVMTSRMMLRQHTLWQVLVGSLVGVGCGWLGVMI